MRNAIHWIAAVALGVFHIVSPALAQSFPTRSIRVIVGPGPDIIPRLFAPKITEVLGQQVIIEPRPGAGGVIAAQSVASAPPDGYMLLQATASYTINTALQTSPLDMRKDFAPVTLVSTIPFVLVVHPSVPAKTLAELIRYAKDNPGKLNYASSGIGTPPHLAGELFKTMAGIDIVHVPFNGSPPAVTATVQNETQMLFAVMQPLKPQIDAGKLRAIAVTTAKRFPLLPDLPTIAESGYPGFASDAWNGVLVPAGTPPAIIERLNREINAVLKLPDVVQKMHGFGFELVGGTPEDFARLIRGDIDRWGPVIKRLGLKVD
jgi:tripartite-type tricarboxylate transporter receptor subunit TctC